MDKDYEFCRKLLLKSYDDYYMALTQKRDQEVPKDVLELLLTGNTEDIYALSAISDLLKEAGRQIRILTFVDDKIYDISKDEFFNTDEIMILCYDKLTSQIDPKLMSFQYNVMKNDVKLKIDPKEFYQKSVLYDQMYTIQCFGNDQTQKFIDEEKPKSLKK